MKRVGGEVQTELILKAISDAQAEQRLTSAREHAEQSKLAHIELERLNHIDITRLSTDEKVQASTASSQDWIYIDVDLKWTNRRNRNAQVIHNLQGRLRPYFVAMEKDLVSFRLSNSGAFFFSLFILTTLIDKPYFCALHDSRSEQSTRVSCSQVIV